MLSSKKHSGFYSPPGSHSTVDRVAKTAQQPFMTVIWKKQNKCSVTEIPPPLWLKFRTGEWRSHTTTTIIQSAWLLLVDHFFKWTTDTTEPSVDHCIQNHRTPQARGPTRVMEYNSWLHTTPPKNQTICLSALPRDNWEEYDNCLKNHKWQRQCGCAAPLFPNQSWKTWDEPNRESFALRLSCGTPWQLPVSFQVCFMQDLSIFIPTSASKPWQRVPYACSEDSTWHSHRRKSSLRIQTVPTPVTALSVSQGLDLKARWLVCTEKE